MRDIREYWDRIINFEALGEEGTISPGDTSLFRYVETAEEAWGIISKAYDVLGPKEMENGP